METFNSEYYTTKYPDLKKAFGWDHTKLYNHWIQYGQNEKRDCGPEVLPFYNEDGLIVKHREQEVDEQHLAWEHIEADDVVLELGARYGTVTCAVNSKLRNKKAHVAVEPDSRVWNALESNLKTHGAEATVWKGFVSKKRLSLINLDSCYGTSAQEDPESTSQSVSFQQLQEDMSMRFNVLVADCEGGLLDFLHDAPEILPQLRMVIFEKDCPDKCDYAKVEDLLRRQKLRCIVKGFQNVWKLT